MRSKIDEEKANQIFCHLECAAFQLYCEAVAHNDNLKEEAKKYSTVKAELIEEFGKKINPEEEMQEAFNARLDPKDLPGSLERMETLYKKAGSSDTASFGLVRKSDTETHDMAHFLVLRAMED